MSAELGTPEAGVTVAALARADGEIGKFADREAGGALVEVVVHAASGAEDARTAGVVALAGLGVGTGREGDGAREEGIGGVAHPGVEACAQGGEGCGVGGIGGEIVRFLRVVEEVEK